MELIATTTLIVIILTLSVLHFRIHHSRIGKMINKIPGPKGVPVIGNTFDLFIPLEAFWALSRKWAAHYYPVYKLWIGRQPVVVFRHPDDVEVLLSSQKNISKSMFYNFLHPWLEEGLLTSTGDKWRVRRKILTPAFHFNMLQEFIAAFTENSERMVKSLQDEGGEVVKDLVPFFAKITLSAICETAMGTTLDDEDPVQEKYRKAVRQMGDIMYYRITRPLYKSDWIFSFSKKSQELREAVKVLHYFTTKIINERKEYHEKTGGKSIGISATGNERSSEAVFEAAQRKKRLAMLDLLIAVQKENRERIDDRGIREEVDTFIFEGHDTTVMGLTFAVALLAENKEIQSRARAEVDDVLKQTSGKLGLSELQNLPYLDRCIKESLRLFPPVPKLSRNVTDDMQIKNYLIPRGSVASLHIFEIHRDPNFWPDPDVFDPDRFQPDRIKNRHPFSYIPFSAGPRNCIGQKFAMLEMKAFIGLLLHNFTFELIEPLSSVRIVPDLVIKSANPINVKFVPI